MNILYEDNHIIVAVKPVNMPVAPDESGDLSMLDALKAYIKEKYGKPGDVFLGLVHRLDRPVGGVMVFARTSKAASRLAPQFAGKAAIKHYVAAVSAGIGYRAALSGYIVKDEATHTSRLTGADHPGAKPCSLSYETIAVRDGLALIDVELHTGRHHQIRVQLAGAGYPIWGDARYAPDSRPGMQIALFCASLSIIHPTLKERMTFTAVPEYGAFTGFLPELRAYAEGLRLVYRDADMIVVDKRQGIAVTMADDPSDSVEARLKWVFPAVYPVHRIDVTTRGLVMFALTSDAAAAIENGLRERSTGKSYSCVVVGRPGRDSARLTCYIKKDADASRVTVYDAPVPGAKEAVTEYAVISCKDGLSLLAVTIYTGRTHQIRAQLAHIGTPILGDDKYGDRDANRAHKTTVPMLCSVGVEALGRRVEIPGPYEL